MALVGYGGAQQAIQNIVDGKQFGTVMQLPATEGRLGVEQLVDGDPDRHRCGGHRPARDPAGGRRRHQGQCRAVPDARRVAGLTRSRRPTMTGDPALLEVRGISRTFGSTRALQDVHVAVQAGSVHALVGENGAGKSTLGKIIAGVLPPDQGELVLRGTPVSFRSPRQALEHGIALVAQELALVPRLTVAQNVFLGAEPRRAGFIDRRALAARFEALLADAGFDLPGGRPGGRPAPSASGSRSRSCARSPATRS